MKTLSILGSTGSIGTQALELVKRHEKEFSVAGLTAHSNTELLQQQIEQCKPEAVAVMDEAKAEEFSKTSSVTVYKGLEGIKKIATLDSCDTVLNSLVGSIGVEPTYEAILAKKNIALANKETLVTAGSIIMDAVKKNDVNLMPIDSEHSAIFQCLNGEHRKELKKIIITCSGGPFKHHTREQLQSVTKKDALNHPNWDMGAKITIDSSTLMNKGFEVIEAKWLFDLSYDDIEVVIHPQSIIHSLVEFVDSSVIAQMGLPSMTIPIQYALTYPKRITTTSDVQLDLTKIKQLDFSAPDIERFPCLQYAYDAGRLGGVMPAVLNAANEVAVAEFLKEHIKYKDIPVIIKAMMDKTNNVKNPNLSEILDMDKKIKDGTKKMIEEEF